MSEPTSLKNAPPVRRSGCVWLALLIAGGWMLWNYWQSHPTAPGTVTESSQGQAELDVVREQQAKLVDEQTQAAREQTRRLYDERIELRRQRIQLIADRLELDGKQDFDKISVVNRCPHDIAVAINYLDLDDKWIVRGWWTLKPGAETTTDAMTRNAKLYFYAENLPSGWKWDGSNRPESRILPIVEERFDYLEGESFLYPDPRQVSFYLVETGPEWRDHLEAFECNPEAGEAKKPGQ